MCPTATLKAVYSKPSTQRATWPPSLVSIHPVLVHSDSKELTRLFAHSWSGQRHRSGESATTCTDDRRPHLASLFYNPYTFDSQYSVLSTLISRILLSTAVVLPVHSAPRHSPLSLSSETPRTIRTPVTTFHDGPIQQLC